MLGKTLMLVVVTLDVMTSTEWVFPDSLVSPAEVFLVTFSPARKIPYHVFTC